MGKIGGLALVVALGLTGCATQSAATAPRTDQVQPAAFFDNSQVAEFVKDVQGSGTAFAPMSAKELADMAHELCQHYDGGFTTEDLRKSDGDKLAQAGEFAKATVCPSR
jgi:hypothetical protein